MLYARFVHAVVMRSASTRNLRKLGHAAVTRKSMIYSPLQLYAQDWRRKRNTTCTFLSSARAAFRSVTDTDFSPSGVADIARGMGESRPPTESVSLRRARAL
jgi:hypothetical protein